MPGLELVSGGLQALGGLAQSIFGGGARRRAQKELEGLVDSYKPNAGILDYYNKALSRYSSNPYTSAAYTNQSNQINRNLATQISAGQDRRAGLMGTAMAVQQANDAEAKNAVNAEAIQGKNLSQLGTATNLKSNEDRRKFDMKYNILAMKAGNSASTENQGYKNIFGGLSNISTLLSGTGAAGGSGTRKRTGDYSYDDSLPV